MNQRQRKRHKEAVKTHQEGRISDPLKFASNKEIKRTLRQKIQDNRIKREMRRKLRAQFRKGEIKEVDFNNAMARLK